jgi:hypothetical protein
MSEETKDSVEVTEEEQHEEQHEEQNLDNYIPKDVALSWKKEMKELKRKLSEYAQKEIEEDHKTKLNKIKSLAAEKGLSDEESEVYSSLAEELFKSIPKQDIVGTEIESEIDDLEDFYPGIKKMKSDLVPLIKKYRKVDPDFTVEDAYRLKAPIKSQREMKLELEQRLANKEREPAPAAGTRPPKSPLDEDDRRILKKMQEAHPDAGWNEEKFIKTMNRTRR